ncbi:MAG TPA: DUF1353 domain-containing protein [Longimicrobium sp.]|nr:DUF1353 domain-containing protein [Longimicrobium sp.]
MKFLATRGLGLAFCSVAATGAADAQSAAPSAQHVSSAAAAPRTEFRIPAVRWFTDRPRQYVLLEPFKYVPPQGREPIVVPAGFVTDFASIPGPLQGAFGPSVHDLPALVHDYLYWRQSCSRTQADEVFYVALDAVGVSSVRRMMIRLGLTVGGPTAYRENARERREQLPRIVPAKYREIPMTTWERYRKELRSLHVQLDTLDAKPPDYCRG